MTEHLYRKIFFCLSFTVISTRFYMHTQNKSSTSVLKYGSLIKSTRTPAFLCNSQRYITIYGLQFCNNHERITCLCLNLCAFLFGIEIPRFWIFFKKTFVTIIESSNLVFLGLFIKYPVPLEPSVCLISQNSQEFREMFFLYRIWNIFFCQLWYMYEFSVQIWRFLFTIQIWRFLALSLVMDDGNYNPCLTIDKC